MFKKIFFIFLCKFSTDDTPNTLMGEFFCEVCGNKNPELFGMKNGKHYCRLCVQYEGFEEIRPIFKTDYENTRLDLPYSLTEGQKRISNKIFQSLLEGRNCFISAVCGSGKTEITVDIISKYLKMGKKIGFAIPRRDVVIELAERMKNAFKNATVVTVYGGHKNVLDGDIIVLTTHQLYRYNCFFDLLILDEADAFPFKDNEVLRNIFKNSIKGNYVIMSATLDSSQEILPDNNVVNLFLYERFHKHDIPVPKIVIKSGVMKLYFLIKKVKEYLNENKPVLIFVPTISQSKNIYKLLKIFAKPGYFVNSKEPEREKIIKNFREGTYKYLVTTMVLERGVTIENLQVIIFDASNKVYSKETLIQISGRAGRKRSHPTGDVFLLSNKISSEMRSSIKTIEYCNLNKNKTYDL